MSRIGKQPIEIPEGVTVKLKDGQVVVKGPLGELKQAIEPAVKVVVKKGKISLSCPEKNKRARALFGLTRALLANMVKGVSQGFSRILKLHGTGYRAKMEGENLVLRLGFSHPVVVPQPEGIKFQLEGNKKIEIKGIDRWLVGNTAAQIRSLKKPEPYKGKGIRFQGEVVRKKPGKAAKVGAGEGGYE